MTTMIKDYLAIALKNLKKRRLRSWLTMIGIFIGIAAVVALISLGAALENAIFGQFGDFAPDILSVTSAETGFGPPGSTAVRKLTDHDVEIVESVLGVEMVIPRYIRNVGATYRGDLSFFMAASMPHDREEIEVIYGAINIEAEEGRLLNEGDSSVIVLGSDVANDNSFERDLKVGDTLKIQGENFRIVGILKPTGTFIINQAIIIMEDDMERVLNLDNEYDILAVKVADVSEVEAVSEMIEEELRRDRRQRPGEEDFSVQTPLETLSAISTTLNAVNLVVLSIAMISLFVGGVGITNTMYTSVLERRKEIGIMKAVGARNRNVLLLFLLEAGFLGLAGGIIGVLVGLTMAYLAAFVVGSALPGIDFRVTLSLPLILGAIAFSFVVGTISGILPALQASRLRPVEAFRK